MRKLALAFLGVLATCLATHSAFAQQKTVKACEQEWRANKAANQAKGITEKAYVAQCRTGTPGASSAPPAPAASTQTKPVAAPPAASRSARPATPASPNAARTGQFSTESEAKSRCGADTVVWANLDSKIYHFAGHKSYGHTKSGAFMCERGALNDGMRAAKNEKHP